jgi:hypothetical protein
MPSQVVRHRHDLYDTQGWIHQLNSLRSVSSALKIMAATSDCILVGFGRPMNLAGRDLLETETQQLPADLNSGRAVF